MTHQKDAGWGPFWAWFFNSWPRRVTAWSTKEPIDPLFDALALEPGQAVVDIGAGSGFHSTMLAERHPDVTVLALDASAAMVARLAHIVQRRGLNGVQPRFGHADALPIDDGAVDAAMSAATMHHLETPADALAEMHRVLRPGGRVAIMDWRSAPPVQAALEEVGFTDVGTVAHGKWAVTTGRKPA